MHEVGITGGIGSGKSTIAKVFETLGYLVYYADDRSKRLLNEQPEVIEAIKAAFGEHIYQVDGKLDRKALASIVFQAPDQLAILNSIVHPATRNDFQTWLDQIPADYPKSFILKEAAILFEAGTTADLEAVISVYAPKNERVKRVMARDGVESTQVIARMNNQWPETAKWLRSKAIIFNDGEHAVIPQVIAIAERLESEFGGQ